MMQMAQTVGDLVRDQQLTCVPKEMLVRDAINLMFEHDYSQLPIQDDDGRIVGLFTDRKLTQAVLMGLGCEIHEWPVSQWMEEAPRVVPRNFGLYNAARLLKDTYALVVGEHGKPVGIVTDTDIAVFLADWSRGLVLIEDIEARLREYIKRVFPTTQSLDTALHHAFGTARDDTNKPAKKCDELTLHDHVQLVITAHNWPRFEPYFRSKTAFTNLLNQAIPIRNQIAHFRGKLTPVQIAKLEAVVQFLARCPRVPDPRAMDYAATGE
jgi:CBS domain-containing protein